MIRNLSYFATVEGEVTQIKAFEVSTKLRQMYFLLYDALCKLKSRLYTYILYTILTYTIDPNITHQQEGPL